MPVPNRMLPFFGLACFVLCASLGRSRAEDQADPPPGEKEAERPAQPLVITKPERPVKLPAGPSASGWDLLLKNDFDGARKSLEAALQANPDDLPALEALRAVAIMQGRYGESQQLNIRMVKASAGSTLCQGLAMRAMDGLSFSETRNELVQAFLETEAKAAPAVRATLQDLLATLYLSRDETEKASAALKDLGYVDRWQFVTGPFGAGDRNNPMERRFPPEQELKELKFSDEKGKPVPVRADLPVGFRTLSLGRLFPGAQGIFYAFTNLESEGEQEVLLVSGAPNGARFYLRGVPVLQADPKERFPRSPTIVRTRLLKGSNALLVKLPFASDLVVRVLATDYSPAPGVKAALLPPEDVAKHRVAPVRGYVFSEAAEGALARHFLEKLPAEARGGPDRFANLARNGELDAAEMRWLDLAVRQESDPPAREALARRMVGTWPDSAHMLDFAAQALASVGQEASHADTRHAEEARQMRERALQLVPGNHQHLLALAEFMQQHQLPEQAFELLKTCAQSYPDSAFAQERLGQTYLSKGMLALAEQRYEAAAKLEPAFLPQLARFHEMAGDRSRALQLRAELVKRGMEPAMERHRRLVDTGALDEASAILDEQERAFPERQDELLVLRAELLIERGDLEGAYKLRAELLKRQPRNRGALIGLFRPGAAHGQAGRGARPAREAPEGSPGRLRAAPAHARTGRPGRRAVVEALRRRSRADRHDALHAGELPPLQPRLDRRLHGHQDLPGPLARILRPHRPEGAEPGRDQRTVGATSRSAAAGHGLRAHAEPRRLGLPAQERPRLQLRAIGELLPGGSGLDPGARVPGARGARRVRAGVRDGLQLQRARRAARGLALGGAGPQAGETGHPQDPPGTGRREDP
ncbi:MAG: hypothetical protein M5U26_09745 [Planctomycetota bacterium]|nr:hypothetical protein [Planctomycetota bacterium]